jgi:hypothetical protein
MLLNKFYVIDPDPDDDESYDSDLNPDYGGWPR